MPTFLFTAQNPQGNLVTDRIESPTVSAARYKLELQGFSEIRFHTDDMERHLQGPPVIDEDREPLPSDVLTPEQELEARRSGGALREIWTAWKRNATFWVPLAIWVAFTLNEGQPFSFWDWLGFGLSGLFLVYFFWIVLPGVAYQKILETGVWYRWGELRRWVKFVRIIKSIGFVPIPDFELDFRLAAGLAAEGNIDAALALVKKHDNEKVGKFMYLSRLAGLYETARKYDEMTQSRREAAAFGTGNPAEKLDLALGLLRRQRNPGLARPILDELEEHDGGDLVKLFHLYCRGLLAIEEGDWKMAQEKLCAAMDAAAPYSQNVLVKGMLSEFKAYRAIALANIGANDEARRLLHEAEPLLKARHETELLDRCYRSLAVASTESTRGSAYAIENSGSN